MKSKTHFSFFTKSLLTWIQFLCLLSAGITEFFIMIFGNVMPYNISHILRMSLFGACFLFVLAAIFHLRRAKTGYYLLAGFAMSIWFLIIQSYQGTSQLLPQQYGFFFVIYLLALPFAAAARDEKRRLGLKLIALVYIAGAIVLIFYAALLFCNYIPEFFRDVLYWNGTRLNVILHPNITARAFMIGIAFSLGFCFQFSSNWIRTLFVILATLFFAALSLTNSRSAILMTCVLISGILFFALPKKNWSQFFLGIVGAFVIAGVLFLSSNLLFEWNSNRLSAFEATQPLVSRDYSDSPILLASTSKTLGMQDTTAPQGDMLNDLPTLNNRTKIWKRTLEGIQNDPSILLKGLDNTTEISGTNHTHNSWLEILVRLGLPAFILSVLFTIQAVWSGIYLLFHRKADLWQKIVSMLVLCFLMSGFLEPFLFFTKENWHFVNFSFFLCLGYLTQWKKALHRKN